MNTIAFPGLGIDFFEIDSVAFTLPIGQGIDIMWYALIITAGFILAFFYASFPAKRNEGFKVDDLLDLMIFIILFGVLGARLYYVVMSPDEFSSFFDVINIRSGGLAIYGGLIAGILAIIGVCKVKKMNLWRVLDMVAPGVMIAQALGRWGNFMNVEAYGSATTLPWRMCSPKIATEMLRKGFVDAEGYKAILDGSLGVHPTFLYESLWNVLGFVLLNLFYKKKRYNGQIVLLYGVWYGFGRMWIEGLRTDSLYLGDTMIRVSQLLSFIIFAGCLALLIVMWVRGKKAPQENLCSFCTATKAAAVAAEEGEGAPAETEDKAERATENNDKNGSEENEPPKKTAIKPDEKEQENGRTD